MKTILATFSMIFTSLVLAQSKLPSGKADEYRKRATLRIQVFNAEVKLVQEGTGFFYGNSGQILTNYHVIKDFINNDSYLIKVSNYKGEVVKQLSIGKCQDERNIDLCVLKGNFKRVRFYFPRRFVKVGKGHPVTLVGHCGESPFQIKKGSILEYMKNPEDKFDLSKSDLNYGVKMIQTSSDQCPGDSGGPIFNQFGELTGIATVIFESKSKKTTYNMGIDASEFNSFLASKFEYKPVKKNRIFATSKSRKMLLQLLE